MIDKKKPNAIGNEILHSKCSFGIGYGIGQKYLPIWVSVSVSDRNHYCDFGRTLIWQLSGYHLAVGLASSGQTVVSKGC